MSVRIDGIVHEAMYLLHSDAAGGHACWPHRPCAQHQRRLVWHVLTSCHLQRWIKGRPKQAQVTCIACLVAVA